MTSVKEGVNAIRLFNTVPEMVTYIHDTYGIYTAVNHLMGRYGFEVDGRNQYRLCEPSPPRCDSGGHQTDGKTVPKRARCFAVHAG